MKKLALCLSLAALLMVLCMTLKAQMNSTEPCPTNPHPAAHISHNEMVNAHGDQAMGFAHDKTTHHFRIASSGGTIEVTANEAADKGSVDAIRSHLTKIAAMFAEGDFATPMFVHDTIPPGVTIMKLLKTKIRVAYDSIDAGGRVRIESSDEIAVAAIHDFLRFQITDHKTGDPIQ